MRDKSRTSGIAAGQEEAGLRRFQKEIWGAPGAQLAATPAMAEQELAIAARIQATFLPKSLPTVPGWEFAVTLQPARQTCGDFYDVIPLPNGRLGLVMADVADKGTGAALYMALSRTLIRTFAILQHTRPDLALNAANHRILQDTDSELFVTVFLAILDPRSGMVTYANAGHNPPLLLHDSGQTELLGQTGIPLGMFSGEPWDFARREMAPGDVLLLYTDGVTEAQGREWRMFGQERLLQRAEAYRGRPAEELKAGLMADLKQFVQDTPQHDDVALMVVKRTGPEAHPA